MDAPVLFLDSETFSSVPIKSGTHAYSEADDAEVMIISYAIDDPLIGEGDVVVVDLTAGERLPQELVDALADPDVVIVMQNGGNFDRIVLDKALGITIPSERVHDTMVQALSHGLPGGLDKLCQIFDVPEALAKHKGGRTYIQMFCVPRPKNSKVRRWTRDTHPVEWQRFLDYAGGDIHSMRYLYKVMPKWNYPGKPKGNARFAPEYELWLLDQKINDRGFRVDTDLATAAVEMVATHKKTLAKRVVDLTDDEVQSATQRDALLKHLLEQYGVDLPDMKKGTLERRLEDQELPGVVRELIAIRLEASGTSQAKYERVLSGVSKDGRLRGTLAFCGASRTGRWAGRLFQPQNMPRPNMKAAAIEAAIEDIKSGVGDLVLDDPMRAASNAIRGSIVASEGHKLVVADLANIEGRVLAWLAGEEWKLKAFAAYDRGEGPDLYLVTAGEILGKRPEDVTDEERQSTGKVPELACLLEGTLVLTARGDVPIEDVLPGDLVWDGASWVPTDGPVFKGEKHVIEYDNLVATPDHLVWVEGSPHPVEFGRAAADRLCLQRSGPRHQAVAPVDRPPLDGCETALREPKQRGLQKLRGPRHPVQIRYDSGSVHMGAGKPRLARDPQGGDRPDRERRSLRTGELALVSGAHEPIAHAAEQDRLSAAPLSRTAPRGAVRGFHPAQPVGAGVDIRGDHRPLAPTVVQTKRRVWDLLNCGPFHRFTASGRLVHNCGYQGAAGAFASMMALYGLDLAEDVVVQIVKGWREKNAMIKAFWYALEEAALEAILQPGVVTTVGKIRFQKKGNWLRMQLPSGRFLCYANPTLVDNDFIQGRKSIAYLGVNSYTRQWDTIKTYGGKLAENAVQATARDVLAYNMPAIEEAGFPVILTVHDEVITEPLDLPEFSVERLERLLAAQPAWADDKLPLASAGFETYRYRKG